LPRAGGSSVKSNFAARMQQVLDNLHSVVLTAAANLAQVIMGFYFERF
jgi:hypothetical protein